MQLYHENEKLRHENEKLRQDIKRLRKAPNEMESDRTYFDCKLVSCNLSGSIKEVVHSLLCKIDYYFPFTIILGGCAFSTK